MAFKQWIQEYVRGTILTIVSGLGAALLAGVLGSVAPFTTSWTTPQRVCFVGGLVLLAFVAGVILVGVAQAFLPHLRAGQSKIQGGSSLSELAAAAREGTPDPLLVAIKTLLDDDLWGMRNALESSVHDLKQTRINNDVLMDRFNQSEEQARRLADEEHASVLALATAEAGRKSVEESLRRAKVQIETERPLYEWATGQIENARGRIAEQIEIVDYQFHMNELNEDVSANFGLSVRLRYWGVLPARIGERDEEYGGFLFFHGRRMGQKAIVGQAMLYRGQSEWLTVRQLLEGDREAVRKDWETGSILVDGSHLQLSIMCDDPGGGEPILGWFSLKEMQWPKPSK